MPLCLYAFVPLCLLCALCCTDTAFAQDGSLPGFQKAAEVRETAEEILASPEFRHFQNRGGKNRNGGDWGDGGPGGGSVGGNGMEGNGKLGKANDGDQGKSSERSNSDSDFSMRAPSIGGPIAAAFGALFHFLAWLCLAAVCAIIVYLVGKAIWDYKRESESGTAAESTTTDQDEPEDHAPGEIPADVYLKHAWELARQGAYREANAQLLLGAMSHIERSGLIRFRRGLTHRDYLRAVRSRDDVHQALRGIVRTYEPLGFGRREATREHFEASLEGYETAFRQTTHPLDA